MISFDQNILWLQVPVDDSVFVKIKHRIEYLCGVVFDLLKGELFDFFNEARKISPCIICHDDNFLFSV
jgi:hypothetical protein